MSAASTARMVASAESDTETAAGAESLEFFTGYPGLGVYDGRTMKRTNVHLTESQLKRLAAMSKRTGLSVAELIRRAVDRMLGDGK